MPDITAQVVMSPTPLLAAQWPGWRICIGSEDVLPEFSNHPHLVLMSDCYAREVRKVPQDEWLRFLVPAIDPADLKYLRMSP